MSLTFIIRKVSSVYNGLSEEKWKEVYQNKMSGGNEGIS